MTDERAHVSHTACAASVLGARPRLSLSRLRRGGSGRVPPTKAPLTKDPTAFLGGYLFRPDRRDQDAKEQDANNFASVAKALFKPFVTFNEFFCQACVEATFPHLF